MGGALFRHPQLWCRLMPDTRSASWMQGPDPDPGVWWPVRLGRQQMRPNRTETDPAAAAAIWEHVSELMDHGAYEEVPDSEEEEQARRLWWRHHPPASVFLAALWHQLRCGYW